jgi:Domain of Unknown Function (DUF1259)
MFRPTHLLAAFLLLIPFCLAGAPTTEPAEKDDAQDLQHQFQQFTENLGGDRSFSDGVLAVKLPRKDLWVQTDMGDIPTAAGIESSFYFYRCSCGKDKVVGQFALADYEVNDVVDALRAGRIDVVSISPMFMDEKPRMMQVRFQGEGNGEDLDATLKSAMDWVGDARSAKQPIQENSHR